MPFEDFKIRLITLRKEHPKAVHYVSASRHLNEYQHILETFDDDREPRGSSGMPCLNVLRGEDLINSAVVVVRYFGGTLLGVGGLVRAYSSAVQAAMQVAYTQGFLVEYIPLHSYEAAVPYSLLKQCHHLAKIHHLSSDNLAFLTHEVQVCFKGKQEDLQRFQASLKEIFYSAK